MNAQRIVAIAAAAFALFEVPAAAVAVSADGSTLTVGESLVLEASLVTSAGRWSFGPARNAYGNAVLLNESDTNGWATLLEVANGGKLYAQAGDSSWWLWNNPGWSPSTAPPSPVSRDGSTLTFTQSQTGHTLMTSAGTWNFGTASNVYGNAVLLNGGATGGWATLLEVANGGKLYAQAGDSSWWLWNSGWSSSTAPMTGAVITGVTFTKDFTRRGGLANGAGWPTTWSNDDNQYSMWGDGRGFGGRFPVEDTPGRSSLGVARIVRNSGNYEGINRYGGVDGECPSTIDGKSHGAPLSLGGILYAWITPGSGASGYESFSLYKSIDYACTWTRVGATFARTTDGVSFGGFVQFGKDNEAAIDTYVYSVAVAVTDASSLDVVQRPGSVMLLRVPAASIENRTAYQFFAGPDAGGQPSWSTDPSKAAAVYTDPDGVGPFAQMSYVPGVGRLVYTNQHGNGFDASGSQSLLTMAEAPEPWGPWTNFYRDPFVAVYSLTVAESQTGDNLVTSAGTWNFGTASNVYGNAVLLNGGETGGRATLLALENEGRPFATLYARAADGSWWRWNNPGWSFAAPLFEQTLFQWNFGPKWFSGRDFTLIFSGTNEGDSWNSINGTFATSP